VHAGSEQAVANKTSGQTDGAERSSCSSTRARSPSRRAGPAPAHDFGIEATGPTATAWSPHGTVDGRPVWRVQQDFTVFGGSLGEVYGEKIVK